MRRMLAARGSSRRVDELAQDVASAVRAEVEFYKSARVETEDDLLASYTEQSAVRVKSLEDREAFDASPASRRVQGGLWPASHCRQ